MNKMDYVFLIPLFKNVRKLNRILQKRTLS